MYVGFGIGIVMGLPALIRIGSGSISCLTIFWGDIMGQTCPPEVSTN